MAERTFHVVCHDCPFEKITDDPDEAVRLDVDHWQQTRHNVEAAEIGL